MRNPLTASTLVVACFAAMSAATAAPKETAAPATTSDTAADQQGSAGASDAELVRDAQNPLLPSWSMIAPASVPLLYQPSGGAVTSGGAVPGGAASPPFFVNYNLASGWYLTSAPFVPASREASAPYGNAPTPAVAPDWQLRAQIAILLPE